MRTRRIITLSVLALLLLCTPIIVVSCYKNATKTSTTSTTVSATVSSATSGQDTVVTMPSYIWKPVAGDVSQQDVDGAASVVLRTQDLGTDWSELNPSATTPRDEVMDERLVQCAFGESPTPLRAYVVGPALMKAGGSTVVQTFVRVVDTQDHNAADFQSFHAKRIAECQRGVYSLEKNANPQQPVKGRKFGKTAPAELQVKSVASPDNSNDVKSYQFTISPPDYAPTYMEVYGWGYGRYEVVLLVEGSQSYADSATVGQWIGAIKARVTKLNP